MGKGTPSKPRAVHINGVPYTAVLCSVDSVDESGRPRTLTVRGDDETMDVSKVNTFLIVYVQTDCLGKKH